jgi:hypothetical protein
MCVAHAEFNASTTDAEVQGNVTAAVAALRVPLVESVMLPQYVAGLKARIGGEASWLDSMANDTASQQRLCAMMPQFAQRCVQFLTHVQRAKVQALSASLGVLQSMEAQLNTDLATKLAAFNLVRRLAWPVEKAGQLVVTQSMPCRLAVLGGPKCQARRRCSCRLLKCCVNSAMLPAKGM